MSDLMNYLAAHAGAWLEFWMVMNLQAAAFGLFILLVDTISRNASPRFRYGIWLVALAKALVPPILTFPAGGGRFLGEVTLPSLVVPLLGASQTPAPLNISLVLLAIIVSATVMLSAIVLLRSRRMWRQLRHAEAVYPDLDPAWNWPRILVSDSIDTPLAAGILQPRIYLTREVLDGPRHTMNAVLYHELSHVRRGDRFVVTLQTLLQVLFALNPVIWIMNLRLHRYREQICDAWALRQSGARPQEYGRLLLGYAERHMAPRLQMQNGTCFFETRRGFVQRVMSLFSDQPEMSLKFRHYLLMSAAVLVIVPLSWKCSDGSSSKDPVAPEQAALSENGRAESGKQPAATTAAIAGGLNALRARLVYPDEARRLNLTGTVVVEVEVRSDGTVGTLKTLRGVHPILDDAALEAVRGLKFEPSMVNGTPVAARMSIPIKFQLK